MPVEIKELIIKVIAVDGQDKAPAANAGQVADTDKEAIIAACVRQVMRILKQSRER